MLGYSVSYIMLVLQKVIPEQKKRNSPTKPKLEMPTRKHTQQIGTRTYYVTNLSDRYEKERKGAEGKAVRMRDDMESNGQTDRYEKMQPKRLEVDENLIGARIEQLWYFNENDGS